MSQLASRGQLRASFLRWALLIVPVVMLAGFLSGQVAGSTAQNPWFAGLVKPSIYPPPAAFGIVWSILYLMMGVALTLVVTARGARGRGAAVAMFIVQLLLNLAWSPLFFAAHRITAALYLLVALDIAVLLTVVMFWRVRRNAALLLLPYFGWVLFATVLNWQFLVANPDADGVGAPAAATTRIRL
ncbi:TspO/MBR family protein [Novosphingobium tardum]|uniref:TspO/MBR family protein n=1 Tax=Novosphingobium tardum TaxID=1538021 RepID=A0ABV8RSD7_9SPHN